MAELQRRVVLASRSAARRTMLTRAGLDFEAVSATIDESAHKRRLMTGDSPPGPAGLAMALAGAKAVSVSVEMPDALVIGSDQVLTADGRLLGKPASMEEARSQLMSLRGTVHELHSAVAIAVGGDLTWQASDVARLRMRPFSDAFLDRYLSTMGDDVCTTVGAYKLEGQGAQLLERIDGDYFTILGMPLMPLLAALRDQGALDV